MKREGKDLEEGPIYIYTRIFIRVYSIYNDYVTTFHVYF